MAVCIFLSAATTAATSYDIQLIPLGDLPGGVFSSSAWAVNQDGSVVVGYTSSNAGTSGFIWDPVNGMQALKDGPGGMGINMARGVSDDGSVVVGRGERPYSFYPVKWDQVNGTVSLREVLDNRSSAANWANAISPDGSVIVGSSSVIGGANTEVRFQAFRWDAVNGMVSLGNLDGIGDSSMAKAVSADGKIVVGRISRSDFLGITEAFRWDEENGMVGLGFPVGYHGSYSTANGISDDGSIIVGDASIELGRTMTAFKWDATNGMIRLEDLDGVREGCWANDVSGDGSIIVGSGFVEHRDGDAVMWRKEDGYTPISLNEFLDEQGIDRKGFHMIWATAISRDGTSIVGLGNGENGSEAYLLKIVEFPDWGGYLIENDQRDIDTKNWLGWLNVMQAPHIWSYGLDGWLYLEEPSADAAGAWTYFYK